MFNAIRRYLPLLVFAVIGFLLWKGLSNDPHHIPSPLVDKAVPAFEKASLMQPSNTLNQRMFYGHVSVLNVFASWCMYCLGEHSVLMDVAQEGRVKLYGLNYKDKRLKAQDWLLQYGNPYRQVIYDPTGDVAVNFGVYGTPETFVIDAAGIIRYKQVGPLTHEVWRTKVWPQVLKLLHAEHKNA